MAVSDGSTLIVRAASRTVARVERLADGTRVVHVVTAQETAVACPSRGVVSTSVKALVVTSPRDMAAAGPDCVALDLNPLALPAGLLRAVLVLRGHRAGPGAGAHHPTIAHPKG